MAVAGRIIRTTKWYQDRYGEYQNIIRNSNALAVNRDELLHGLKELEQEYTPDLDFFNILFPAGLRADEIPAIGGNWDIVRNTAGTYVDRNGIIQTASNNEPRFDWLNGTPELLVEPQRTNFYLNSEPTANEGIGTAGLVYESFDWGDIGFTNCVRFPVDGTSRARYGATAPASTQVSLSVYVIMDDNSEPVITTSASDSNTDFRFVIAGAVAMTSITIKRYKSTNIYRVTGTITTGTTLLANSGIQKTSLHSGKSFRCVGWQLEAGVEETSYIKTTGSTVTRNADEIELDPEMGVSEIILNDDAPITTIPSTYQLPNGRYKRVLMR